MNKQNKESMIFEKGDKEDLLWEYFRFNITDCLDGLDLIDNSKLKFIDKILTRPNGTLKHKIEIIIKVDDKQVNNNAWKVKQ
jgi:hypothetical protein